jgi:hypothetical protein
VNEFYCYLNICTKYLRHGHIQSRIFILFSYNQVPRTGYLFSSSKLSINLFQLLIIFLYVLSSKNAVDDGTELMKSNRFNYQYTSISYHPVINKFFDIVLLMIYLIFIMELLNRIKSQSLYTN